MPPAEPGVPARRAAGTPPAVLGVAAVVAFCGFRVGVVPGGLVGVDLALALVGWWLAVDLADRSSARRRAAALWQLGWPAVALAVALAVVWALVEPSASADAAARGQGLAAFAGYGNWHLLAVGPPEAHPTRLDTPLQHLWTWAVLVQLVLAWLLVDHLARGRAGTAPAERRAVVLAVVAGACWLVALGLVLGGAGDQTVLLATPVRATALFGAAAVATAAASPVGRTLRAVAVGVAVPTLVLLGVLALIAAPDAPVGRICGSLVVPPLAVLAVAATGAWPTRRRVGGARPSAWFVGAWFVVPAGLAVAWAATDGGGIGWAVAATVGGLAIAAGPVIGYGWFVEGHPPGEPTSARRRVLAPPAVVALLVLLGSVTGAFHWESPQPTERWSAPAGPPG